MNHIYVSCPLEDGMGGRMYRMEGVVSTDPFFLAMRPVYGIV